jgi:ABC-type antimicrobial peptide transport system permease subunit
VVRVVGSGKELLVVGVVGDVLNQTLDQAAIPGLYYSSMQRLWPTMDVVVRTRGVPDTAIAEARQVLRELDPTLPLATVKSMDEWIGESVARPRMQAALVTVFGASALLIGVIGIYGVLSFSVSQRTREIGVRMAMGAEESAVVRFVLGEGMLVAGIGIVAGIAGAAALSRLLATMLFGVGSHDPFAFAAAPAVLAIAACAACYIPARRAARIDPVSCLRE